MRTTTAQQLNALGLAHRATHARVDVDRTGSGDWADLTNLEGFNWLVSLSYGENVDELAAHADIKLRRRVESLSLVPFDDDSKINQAGTLIDLGHKIRIYTAVLGMDEQPVAADWNKVFDGYIDEIAWEKDPIVLRCRDLGAEVIDAFIETQQVYPHDPATSDDVEDIMQTLLDDVLGTVTLYSPNGSGGTPFNPADSPSWVINQYLQRKMHLGEALQVLADQMGYVVRYVWHAGTSDFQLVLYCPDRAKSTPDHTFGPGQYFPIEQLGLRRHTIRNAIRVSFMDGVYSPPIPDQVTRTDATSIAKYGRRFMEIAEGASSQINSTTEANAFGDAALADLKEPNLEKSVPVPYFWPAELGDLYRFTANELHYTSDQDLAVVGFEHTLTNGKEARTKLMCRGLPAGGFKRWLSMDARLGLGAAGDVRGDDAPDNAAAEPGLGSIIVTYDDPRGMTPPIADWAFTKCHVSTSNGFTPAAGNLVATGRTTRFEVSGLVPGTTYYCKLVIVDAAGNESTVSSQVTATTEMVGPYHTNPDSEGAIVNPNSNFGVATKDITTTEPDAWHVSFNDWDSTPVAGDGAWYMSTSVHQTGGRSVAIESLDMPPADAYAYREFYSDKFPVSEDALYTVDFAWRHNGSGGNNTLWVPYFSWYDENDNWISDVVPLDTFNAYSLSTPLGLAANTWFFDRGWLKAPSTARYCQISIFSRVRTSTLGQARQPRIYFDRFAVTRSTARLQHLGGVTDRSSAANTWVRPWLQAGAAIDNTADWSPGVSTTPVDHYYTIPYDGEYDVSGVVAWTAMGSGQVMEARITSNGANVQTSPPITYGGVGGICAAIGIGPVSFAAGDLVRLEGRHDDAAGRNLDDSECRLYITQRSNR